MAKAPVLTPQAEDFPRWYQDVIAKAELADNGPIRGTMVIRPYGYSLWERMQAEVDDRIKAAGAQNAYFPLFIPQSYLEKEADHVDGFSPELAVVTHGGGKELEEPAVVRPTSETIINVYFAKWVQSYRDLPLLINQWANVVRWEMRPRVFLRTTEFLWQEGHTAHASAEEAREYSVRILEDVYADFMINVLALPVLQGLKTPAETFPGASNSLACEAMMADGKALQMGTSHQLGQNFSKMFDILFLDSSGSQEYAWQTSWGVSTRMVGGLIMAHGDDAGLRIPPRLAPIQAVVLVVHDDEGVVEAARTLAQDLTAQGIRVELDDQVGVSFGRRATDWELKGIPLRVEVGPRDLANGEATLVRRDSGEKVQLPLSAIAAQAVEALDAAQSALLATATAFRDDNTVDVATVAEAAAAAETGFALISWDVLGVAGETELAASGVTVRCLTGPMAGFPTRSTSRIWSLPWRGPIDGLTRREQQRGGLYSFVAVFSCSTRRGLRSTPFLNDGTVTDASRLAAISTAEEESVGVEEQVRAVMEPILTDLGVELIDVNWGGARLRLTVDAESGISSALLATATRNISRELDATDPIPGKYTLEVTSPGLERPLRNAEQFARAVGDQVTVKLKATAASDAGRRVRGLLASADSESILIEAEDGMSHTIELTDISKARTVFEWGPNSKEATAR